MDAADDLSDPITLITDPAKSVNNPDNPAITAGFTFLGQFLDHDMTFDPTSSLARQQDPESIRNFRIPALDLDSVYGSGPGGSPHLYDSTIDGRRTTFLLEEIQGSGAVSVDGKTSPRRAAQQPEHRARRRSPQRREPDRLSISPPLLGFHNKVIDDVRAELGPGHTDGEIFREAQQGGPTGAPSGSSSTSSW